MKRKKKLFISVLAALIVATTATSTAFAQTTTNISSQSIFLSSNL